MNQNNLTLKQQEFVRIYVEIGNATEAVWRSYNVKRREIAAVMAKQLKKKPHIREAIRIAQENRNITKEQVIRNLVYIANLKPKRISAGAWLRANIALLKIRGTYR